jgi:hypothetical protein
VGLDLYWMREAELKHCRLAMLAVAHTLFCETVGSFPGMVGISRCTIASVFTCMCSP